MAFVTNLIVDKRIGARDFGTNTSCSNLETALNAIRALDGKARTQVILEGPDRAFIVGGGNQGRYNAVIAVNVDEEFFNLVNPGASSDREVSIVTGGQAGLFPEKLAVDLATTLKAAESFFNTGQPSSDLTWERA